MDEGSDKPEPPAYDALRSLRPDLLEKAPTSPPLSARASIRSFESLTELSPFSRADPYGVSILGATSPENLAYIDGLCVTDPAYGLVGIPLSTAFIREIRVLAGGLSAEQRGSTGGVFDVTTKSGSNEFHGSVFSSITPGVFEGARAQGDHDGGAIRTATSLSSIRDFGVDLGGPILKDRLWFYAGLSSSLSRYALDRSIYAREIKDGRWVVGDDGFVSASPVLGSSELYYADARALQYIGKLAFAINQDHRLTASVFGASTSSGGDGTFAIDAGSGAPEVDNILGTYGALATARANSSVGVALRWESAYWNETVLVDAALNGYYGSESRLPSDRTGLGSHEGLSDFAHVIYRRSQNPGYHSVLEFEDTPRSSTTGEPYCAPQAGAPDVDGNPTVLDVCPLRRYSIGGPGFLQEASSDRYHGRVTVTYLFTGLGHHALKGGVEAERASVDDARAYSGTTIFRESLGGTSFADVGRYGFLVGPDDPVILDVRRATATSTVVGAFLQDSWSVFDRVNVNAGVRYDAQRIHGANDKLGLSLLNQWSPRLSVAYDFTREGRSRLFASFARYYETVPLDIAVRSFPDETRIAASRSRADCDPISVDEQKSEGCVAKLRRLGGENDLSPHWISSGGNWVPVDPDAAPTSVDEIVVGGEYDLFLGGRAGVQYSKRRTARVIEDMSLDGGESFFIGNPGDGLGAGFPSATRDIDALTLYFTKASSAGWLAQASYTLSFLRGNWEGLFRAEDGQLDPNITSEFDAITTQANRDGPLPGDRTHAIRLFGAKDLALGGAVSVSVGLGYQGRSGGPTNFLGGDARLGDDQVFILPRGSGDRLPWVHSVDARVGLGVKLAASSELRVGVDVFNIANFQAPVAVDETFTSAPVLPICGASGSPSTRSDLPVQNADRSYTCVPPQCKLTYADGAPFDGAATNPTFGRPVAFQAPRSVRISASVTF